MRSLRLWDVWIGGLNGGLSIEEAERRFVESLATLQLDELVWSKGGKGAPDGAGPPLALFEVERQHGLRRLALHVDSMDLESPLEEGAFRRLTGWKDLEELVLLGHEEFPRAFARELIGTLDGPSSVSLRVLHVGAEAFNSLYELAMIPELRSHLLEHLGTIECSWLNPSLVFDQVEWWRTPPPHWQGLPLPDLLTHLTSLSIFVNSERPPQSR